MSRSRIVIAALILSAVAAPAGAAQVATAPGGFAAGWLPPVVVIAEGEGITYTNADIAPHNFIASDALMPNKAAKKAKWCSGYDRGKCPLFWSPTIGTGETTEVLGLDVLRSGEQFGFLCTLHPNMQGTLIVR